MTPKYYCRECDSECKKDGSSWACPVHGKVESVRVDYCDCEGEGECEWPGFHKRGITGVIWIE
jgi:hypothetical protein